MEGGTEKEKRKKRGIKRERKLNQSFQEHEVIGPLFAPYPAAVPRPPIVMASAFHASCQPPLSQNPAYAPACCMASSSSAFFF